MKKNTKAFTLVEVIIVVLVVGVLSGVTIPRIKTTVQQARYKACSSNVARINSQVELFYRLKEEWPETDLSDIGADPEFFPDGLPVCPATGYNYWLYEDTLHVGGHNQDDNDAHTELGYTTLGDYIYDSQGRLIGYVRESGNKVYKYSAFEYDEFGNIVLYERTDYDDKGEKLRSYKYSERVFDPATGKITDYKRKEYDADDNLSRSYDFHYTYDANGNRTEYSYERYRGDDTKDAVYSQSYDADGNVSSANTIYYDETGNSQTKRYSSSDYTYDDDSGKVLSFHRDDYDADDNLFRKYDFDYSYDADGNRTQYSYDRFRADNTKALVYSQDYGADGKVSSRNMIYYDETGNNQTRRYAYSSYIYDPDTGKTTGYRRENYDASDTHTGWQDYTFNYNESGQRTQLAFEEYRSDSTQKRSYSTSYNDNGKVSSYLSISYDTNSVKTNSREQNQYTYDPASGALIKYYRINRDANDVVTWEGWIIA